MNIQADNSITAYLRLFSTVSRDNPVDKSRLAEPSLMLIRLRENCSIFNHQTLT